MVVLFDAMKNTTGKKMQPRRGCRMQLLYRMRPTFLYLGSDQARAGENVPCAAIPSLVACRWRSA